MIAFLAVVIVLATFAAGFVAGFAFANRTDPDLE